MAERIQHTATSAVTTTGWETAKGALFGAIAAAAIGGLLVAGVAAAGSVMLGVSLFTGVAGLLTTAGIVAASVASFVGLGPAATIAGGALGLLKGGSKVSSENAAAMRRREIIAHSHDAGHAQVAQQAYAMGVHAGQMNVVQQLQAYHEQMVQEQMMAAAKENPAGIGPQSAKIRQQQAAAQATGAQIA